jgi:hypothetical protein
MNRSAVESILMEDAHRTVNNQNAQLPGRRLEHNEHFRATRLLGSRRTECEYCNSILVACSISLPSIHTLVSTRVLFGRQLEDQQLPRVSSSTAELAFPRLYSLSAKKHEQTRLGCN